MDRRVMHHGGKLIGGMKTLAAMVALALLSGCVTTPVGQYSKQESAQIAQRLTTDISMLASEEFGGRRPGTAGEDLTLDYVRKNLESAGYVSGTNDPANPWRAPVELVSTRPEGGSMEIVQGRKRIVLPPEQSVVYSARKRTLVEQAPILFVGFESETLGEDVVRGNVIAMLAEPGVSPQRRSDFFDKGAAAVITLVETEDDVASVKASRNRERLSRPSKDDDFLSAYATYGAFGNAIGTDEWTKLLAQAQDDEFSPVTLKAEVTLEALTDRHDVRTANLIGMLPGTKPGKGAVLLLAHWDHLGDCGPLEDADRLCNGAVDNASGVSLMMELARQLSASGPHDRDIYVLATTAEEWGLIGAEAFAESPPIPLETIVAAFNFDTVAIARSGSPVGFVGEGRTRLDDVVREVMGEAAREFADRELTEQFIRRQDAWALLQHDVPAVVLSTAFGDKAALDSYLIGRYHRAADNPDTLELGGAIEDLKLHQMLVERIASTTRYPLPQN